VVAKALLHLEAKNAWSNLTLDGALSGAGLKGQDAAFAGMLFYGVVERRLTLDACIAAHSSQPPHKLQPEVLCALRLGVYQLVYMDSVPDHAAVSESVSLVKGFGRSAASGFVNGVLRGFLRGGKKIPLPEKPLARKMSVRYSCPEPLVRLWLEAYGEEAAGRFLEASLGRAPVSARVNTLRISPAELIARLFEEGVAASVHPDIPEVLLLERTGAIHRLSAYLEGLFHIQDPSSVLCARALDPRPGHNVLDACAAPGGKSFSLLELMGGEGRVTACELHPQRAELMQKRAREMGFGDLGKLDIIACDMSRPDERLVPRFDRVLCDVPCSGYGAIRRKPEIKYKPLEEFGSIAKTQYKILENSSHYCKEGARLIYSTCTLNPSENEELCDLFLKANKGFSPAPLGGLLGDMPRRTLTGEFMGDGFFLAAFVREG
jgi:16S rRNA (cytosine967-C5)-methyltransferase